MRPLCVVLLSLCAPLVATAVRAADRPLPHVVSLNLCTDLQLLLLADPAQIASLTWLASDQRSSPLAAEARRYPANRGLTEEILPLAPDVVLVGSYTARFTVDLLRRLGVRVVEVAPAESLAEIEDRMLAIGSAIGQRARALRLNAAFRAELARTADVWRSAARAAGQLPSAVLIGAGGFAGGTDTLSGDVLRHVGLRNVVGSGGDQAWGRFSIEDLLRLRPDVLVIAIDPSDRPAPSLAFESLNHPAIRAGSLGMQRLQIPATYWSCSTPLVARAAALLAAAAPPSGS